MRNLIFTFIFSLFSLVSLGQSPDTVKLSYENPIITVGEKTFELLEFDELDRAKIRYTEVSSTGFTTRGFYLGNKVDGLWEQIDSNGNILASLQYDQGVKVWYRKYLPNQDVTIRYINGKAFSVETKKLLANN